MYHVIIFSCQLLSLTTTKFPTKDRHKSLSPQTTLNWSSISERYNILPAKEDHCFGWVSSRDNFCWWENCLTVSVCFDDDGNYDNSVGNIMPEWWWRSWWAMMKWGYFSFHFYLTVLFHKIMDFRLNVPCGFVHGVISSVLLTWFIGSELVWRK